MRLDEIFEQYKDRVEIFVVYIREAHPEDGWQIEDNIDDDVIYAEPTTYEEREAVAGACALKLDLKIPTLIDDMTNGVEEAYRAMPDRFYVIGKDGRVAYKSPQGPFGFRPKKFAEAIDRTLAAE